VTDACFAVGCTSLGSFSSRFTELVGETPSAYRARDHGEFRVVAPCQMMVVTRPRKHGGPRPIDEISFGEASSPSRA
jgi:AraC-like DNA-binding protein